MLIDLFSPSPSKVPVFISFFQKLHTCILKSLTSFNIFAQCFETLTFFSQMHNQMDPVMVRENHLLMES